MQIIKHKITKWVDFSTGGSQRRIYFPNNNDHISINYCNTEDYCIIHCSEIGCHFVIDSLNEEIKKSRKEIFDIALKYAIEKFN